MNELLNVVIFSIIGAIVSLSIVVLFFKKKKNHKDFKAVVFTFSLFLLICLYLSVTGLIDIINIKNGNVQSSGMCKIVEFNNVGGRFGSESFFQIIVNDITVEADHEEFSYLKEGNYECTIQYGENTLKLINIEFK